jgi:signal transduction histidine kinase/DNA-binding response OmpR family regulator
MRKPKNNPTHKVTFYLIHLILFLGTNAIFSNPIIIKEDFETLEIGKYVEIFEDTSQALTINDILENKEIQYRTHQFKQLTIGGRKHVNVWIKIPVINNSDSTFSLVLHTKDVFIKTLTGFITKDKTLINTYKSGYQVPFRQRKMLYTHSAFPFEISPKSKMDLFIMIDRSDDPIQFPIRLSTLKSFQGQGFTTYLKQGFFLGILFIIFLFSLALLIATRSRLNFLFSLYSLLVFLLFFSIAGYDFQYVYPNWLNVGHRAMAFWGVICALSLFALIIEYYKEENENIRFARPILKGLLPFGFIVLLLLIFHQYFFSLVPKRNLAFDYIPMFFISVVSLFMYYSILKITFRNPSWTNLIFLIGYSGTLITGILNSLIYNGVIILPEESFFYHRVGILIEMFCLTILMTHKIFKLHNEKLQLDTEVELARMEKEKADKIRELDRAKTQLYTNITHEFRTPLTVINGLAEQLQGNEDKKKIIHRNSNILLRLINQMLDLAKADRGEIQLRNIQNDIVNFVRYLSESFESWGASKNIRLHFLPEMEDCVMDYDPDRLQDILSNLLSNAIKHTEKGGDIYIILKKLDDELLIKVKDTGKGIEEKYLPKIFDRFYQVEQTDSKSDVGTGIGLALCKEWVTLMNGDISVKSTIGKGSEFSIRLPITSDAPIQSFTIEPQNDIPLTQKLDIDETSELDENSKLPLILVVEDNPDVRHYIKLCLKKDYQLITAENGKIGIEKALEFSPDLILSDIMMPDTNGLELCEHLKTNVITSHIPIILLTAKADDDAKIQGITRGADAYLTKPFNKKELLARIHSLILQRKRMQAHFLKNSDTSKTKKFETENQFLKDLKAILFEHLSDEDFDVVRLSKAIGMSRSQVYRKVKALTGRSIASYIRYIRLQEGKKLLETTEKTVSEIAFDVGFKDLSYFSNTFSQEFGYPPNAVRK